jgi:hypothetical protein
MRSILAAAALGLIASSCSAMPDSSVATPAPSASVITRPAANKQGDRPVVLRSLPEAGAFVTSFAPAWRYDGHLQTLDFPASTPPTPEHSAPAGGLVALERQTQTLGRYLVSTELAIRDRSTGPDRTLYRAPLMFYWSGWSPDGRFVAIWEVDFFSGSLDLDGRPLIVIDARTGMRFDLGRTLLHGTTAWSPPHTLAFVAGFGREVSQEKTLRLWAPEIGIRDVSPVGTAALAPVWSAGGQSLYFVSGPAGQYDPLPFFTGHLIGDRRISVYDLATSTTRVLAHEPGYVEEGARPSRDGSRLLVLRRRTVEVTTVPAISIRDAPLEVWLTDGQGARGTALVRIANVGFGYYGWYPGPSEWDWSE